GNVGVFCSGSNATTIIGNYFERWKGACIAANADSAKDLVIQGNSLHADAGAELITLSSSSGTNDRVAVLHNHFSNFGSPYATTGIVLGNTTNCVILGNGPPAGGASVISGQSNPDLLNVSGAGTFGDRVQVSSSSSMYSGSGAPAASLGANGDYYFRTDTPGTVNQRIYIKSAGSWLGIV